MLCLDNYYMETVQDILKNQTVLKPVYSPNISLKISLILKTGPILVFTVPSSLQLHDGKENVFECIFKEITGTVVCPRKICIPRYSTCIYRKLLQLVMLV